MTTKLFSKNFTMLILGQVSSLFGNFILKLSLSMYVLEVTGSAADFAGILSAATVPMIVLSPFGGVLADRLNKRNIMVLLDCLNGVSVLCAVLLLSAGGGIAAVAVLLVVLSVLGAFETPTVQACIPSMLSGDNIIKGNAVVNQVASVSYLVAPMLGGVLYAVFGLKPVMYASVVCFFITALFECFIKLDYEKPEAAGGFLSSVKNDFSLSVRFMLTEQPDILKTLLLAAFARFFIIGVSEVGLPYIVRNILSLGSEYYGAAQSMQAVATILGSIAAGLFIGKLTAGKIYLTLAAMGAFLVPAGIVFLVFSGSVTRYLVIALAFCGMQLAGSVFSIFAVSAIQQKTPPNLIGKIMAYTAAVTMCVQPFGQIIYGFLFDWLSGAVYLVLIPTGLTVLAIGLLAAGRFGGAKNKAAVK